MIRVGETSVFSIWGLPRVSLPRPARNDVPNRHCEGVNAGFW
jgi:hypothetical protein